MRHEDVAALMKGAAPAIQAWFAEAVAPLVDQVKSLELQLAELRNQPRPLDGKSVTAADVQPLLEELVGKQVQEAVAALPAAKDGRDGLDGKDGAAGEKGEPGKDGRDGVDGKDGAAGEKGEPGKDGRDGVDGKDGVAGEKGVGFADVMLDRGGELVVSFTDGRHKSVGVVVGRDGAAGAAGKDGEAGKDGRDGFGFEDLALEYDGERSIVLRFTRGELVKEFPLRFALPLYRDVYEEGASYLKGDMVTWAGSLWHCNADTSDKPGMGNKNWRLAAKRGRDGKEPVKLGGGE